jgi:hypothetical protein
MQVDTDLELVNHVLRELLATLELSDELMPGNWGCLLGHTRCTGITRCRTT